MATIEYEDEDLERGIRDFEEQVQKFKNSMLYESIRKEKAVSLDAPRATGDSIEEGKMRNRPGMAIRFTQHSLEYVKEKFLSVLRHNVSRIDPPKIEVHLLGSNLTVDEMKIVRFDVPTIKTENLGDGVFRVQTNHGMAKIRGSYKNVYKTIREGQFEAVFTGFDLDFKFKYFKTFDERLKIFQLIDKSCRFKLESLEVLLDPELAGVFSQKLQEELLKRLYESICPGLEESLNNFIDVMPHLVHFLNPVDSAKHFIQEVQFDSRVTSEPLVTKEFTQIEIRGEFISNRTQFEDQPAQLQVSSEDDSKMVYTYVSDHTVTTLLRQLLSFGDVKFNLHVLTEIIDFLRPECAKFELCLGHFADLQAVDPTSGRLVVRSRAAPRVRFHQGAAHVHLRTAIEISYRKADELFVQDEIYARFDAEISLRLTHLRILKGITPGHYEWTARVHIDQISVDNGVAVNSKMSNFIENLQAIMNKSRKYLETLITSHLRSSIPIVFSKSIELESISCEFRDRTLVLGFNLDIDSRLFPHLSLPQPSASQIISRRN